MLRASLIIVLFLAAIGCDRGPGSASGKPQPQDAPKTSSRPEPVAEGTGSWQEESKAAIDRGIRYLRENQTPDGKWKFNSTRPPDIGMTGLCLLAMLQAPRKYREDDGPFIRQGIEWIASSQKPDGSIHGGMLATYNTSVAILALTATGNPKYRPIIDRAVEYLRVVQSDEGEKYTPKDRFYGGVSYGDNERPDLSNTQFALEAASIGGMKDDDPFFTKATTFLQRCQNRSESNDLADTDVVPGNNGGGFYSPATGDHEAKAGFVTLPNGKKERRSYGSMSYALLKSYLFCKLKPTDPRVQAVIDWLSKNYRVDYNPGMEGASDKPNARYAGLFYYYLSMARTLGSSKSVVLKDEAGKPRDWQQDLAKAILALQQPDGSWVNERNDEFWEASPVISTAHAINSLNACLK